MAGHAECARGSDRASKIMKFDGLPEKGKLIAEEVKQPKEIPVLGSFISTMGLSGANVNAQQPFSIASDQRPKFTAKITLFDAHGDDNF